LSELKLRHTKDGVILPVQLTPKSARDEISGVEDFGGETVLKARVRALPEQGRANVALELLGRDVARGTVVISEGSARRQIADKAGAD
jgi:uncharacterized protein YggU (UPF0235/DUF167 family)